MKSPFTLFTVVALFLAQGIQPALSAPGKEKGKDKVKSKAAPFARDKGKDKSKPVIPAQAKNRRDGGPRKTLHHDWRFHDRDRANFQSHFQKYKQHPHGLPPGLAKKLQRGKPLPPGWQKKVREGWVIDNSMWGHFHPVPPDYLPASLHHPRDTEFFLIGDRLVRVHKPKRQIIDLIRISSIALNR